MTITKEILKAKIDYLNSISKNRYDLIYAYGGVRIVLCTETGGIVDISVRGTKSTIADILDSMVKFHIYETEAQ